MMPRATLFICSAAAIGSALSSASPLAAGGQFRAIPAVPNVPPAIDHPAERRIIAQDIDQIVRRRTSLVAVRKEFARDCDQRRTGGSLSRLCQFRQVEIRRETSRLRTDINALRNRLREIGRNVQRRRAGDRNSPVGVRDQAGGEQRTDIVRKALSHGGTTWPAVLTMVRKRAQAEAGNPAMRDAAAYLEEFSLGRIAARRLDNPYYKHGVRRSLAGDHWSAAVAFARAARDDPSDKQVYASYAHAAGRQHRSPACVRTNRCVAGDIIAWSGRIGPRHPVRMRALVDASDTKHVAHGLRRLILMLKAIAVYDGAASAGAIAPDAANDALGSGPDAKAARTYLDVWQAAAGERAADFYASYGERISEMSSADESKKSRPRRLPDFYISILRDAFAGDGSRNPFVGSLTRVQIIGLQR